MYYCLPYKAVPKIMIKAAAKCALKWLNMFPPKGGVSQYYSPGAIIMGKPLNYNNNCKYSFESYVIALNKNNLMNTPAPKNLIAYFWIQMIIQQVDLNCYTWQQIK